MNKQLDEILTRKMDRRSFIKHLGVGMLAIFGLGAVLKMLSPVEKKAGPVNTQQALAYGGGAYGGRRLS
jgi:hypothetical protein